MKKYICETCGYVYDPAKGDPESGIAPGTAFEDLPADWVCPLCGVGKEDFPPEHKPRARSGAMGGRLGWGGGAPAGFTNLSN